MTLSYDFDVFSVIPTELGDDPAIGALFDDVGFDSDAMSNKVALFRDQATVDALKVADPRMLKLFEDSGFGFTVYDSGAGNGAVPDADREDHAGFLDRVSANVYEVYSEAEIHEGGVLVNPSVDGFYQSGHEPEGAFVFMDWLNATIAVHEAEPVQEADAVTDVEADAEAEASVEIELEAEMKAEVDSDFEIEDPLEAEVRDTILVASESMDLDVLDPTESENADVEDADLKEELDLAMRLEMADPKPEEEQPKKSVLKRKRSRVLKADQIETDDDDEAKAQAAAMSPVTRASMLDRFNSPMMGVVAGIMVGGFGIVLVSKLLA